MALIRSACLASQDRWVKPTRQELSAVIAIVLANAPRCRAMSESTTTWLAAHSLAGTRDELSPITYALWAELCQLAGLGDISLNGVAHNLLTP